ncbi:DNA-binding transcriptional regulator, AcrR family [Amycolatopsis arida]|uniref:DNA-binding transcriptional regulator, AcrR family n=1 Tax=Amycolatopsis arida TaxID=587909 RepID=A0A1I5XVU6_9PSEU|nr:TetR family transcriptional regulator [Amycolatopsis arida]TDX97234.1 AcrR family transcriptional regulator [Amycolatopsis arida]SFQ36069.1 DNA-binding transcriptional regulator, AcrR family [Amycolatopsis arida]
MTADVRDAEGTRARLLATALRLFTEHGVEGTSLQMIADALGVTKAAVYYHFKAKDEITAAVTEPALRELETIVADAEAQRRRGAQVDHLLAGFVDLIVRHRALVALFSSDPGVARAIEHAAGDFEGLKERLVSVLVGPEPELRTTVAAHVALAGLALAGGAPYLAHLDDDTLRAELLDIGRRLLGRPRRAAR